MAKITFTPQELRVLRPEELEFLQTLADGGRPLDKATAGEIIDLAITMRNERRFEALRLFTDRCLSLKLDFPTIRRLNAHALIEFGQFGKAVCILIGIAEDHKDDRLEYSQAIGMVGRAYKQMFLDNQNRPDQFFVYEALRRAFKNYLLGLKASAGTHDYIWHGVNLAAIAKRAERDGVALPENVDVREIAQNVENQILASEHEGKLTAWDCINAGEACLALDQPERATEWFAKYSQNVEKGKYALHSFLRQLQGLWQIQPSGSPIGKAVAMLQARLYGVEKGNIDLENVTLADLPRPDELAGVDLERVIGRGGFEIYSSFVKALNRGRAIARIGTCDEPGIGTGFVVDGGAFSERWKGQRLLLTNAHVVSDDPQVQAKHQSLRPDETQVVFTHGAPRQVFGVKEIVWSSPPDELDASLLALDQPLPDDMGVCDIAPALPPPGWPQDQGPVLYILGHPKGGPLSISLNDNHMIEYEAALGYPPPYRVRIRYRTPTEGGNSGSPVFHGDDWRVIGLHHAYSKRFFPLAGEGLPYEANQAIWIQSIVNQTRP